MIYRKSFEKEALYELNVDQALDKIRAELAENFISAHNKYSKTKYSVILDFYTQGFPLEDGILPDTIINLASKTIDYSYGLNGCGERYRKEFLEDFLQIRDDLSEQMKSL